MTIKIVTEIFRIRTNHSWCPGNLETVSKILGLTNFIALRKGFTSPIWVFLWMQRSETSDFLFDALRNVSLIFLLRLNATIDGRDNISWKRGEVFATCFIVWCNT